MAEALFPAYSIRAFLPMALGGTLIVLMGLYDDIYDMPSLPKLLIELVIGVVLYFWGFEARDIASPFGGTFHAGMLAILITPLWIAGVMNAINFTDGLDGLAAGLVFICAATLFAIGYRNGQTVSCVLMAYLMGTTLGFLPYNFNPATMFMGDTGALFLGFVLGAATLIEQQKGVAVIALAIPVTVMAVPILDTVLSFTRRLRRAREGRFFTPDRSHLHHRLLAAGMSHRQVVLSLYFVSLCMGTLAFALSLVSVAQKFIVLALAGVLIVVAVMVLHYFEGRPEKLKHND
jgi:UDP-GlcNAc:undecaprenyl-phosphate/decaprenyl-phosphate GlcNAc-1-phosphate transferase